MKKILLLVTVLFASVSSFAQGEGELVSNDVTVTVNDLYGTFISSYPDSAIERVNKGQKLTIKYKSDNEKVVLPFGNLFKTVGAGTCNVTFRLAPVWPGTNDTFDENHVLLEKNIKVTVVDKDTMAMPTFELTWGATREEIKTNQNKWGHEYYTKKYFSHFPNVVENEPELVSKTEVFYNTGNFYAPLTLCQFNNDDVMIATTVMFSSNTAVTSTDGYVYNWLKGKGFKYAAPEDPSDMTYWHLVLNHEGILTRASWEKIIIDNVWFVAVNFYYDSPASSIDQITDEDVQLNIFTEGTTININAPEFEGRKLNVTDLSGKLVSSETVTTSGNVINVPAHGIYIVKINGVKAVKVVL